MDIRTKFLVEAQSYRNMMRVSAVRCFRTATGYTSFPICPRCQMTMEREYQAYCDRCGQALGWRDFPETVIIVVG